MLPLPLPGPLAAAQEKEYPVGELTEVSEEVLNWAGRTSLLPRLATLCFLLVMALVLRTITDSGLINKLIGSGIGMGYAAILMGFGWYKYAGQSPLAPVFAACGAILMSTIVVETHTHFQSLPLVPAYLTLMATGIGMALISRRFNAFTPISVGILGMCLAGAAIDYPHPFFPYLSLLLLTANVLGYFAAQLKRCSWLRWLVLLVTMVMLQLWGVQIVSALRKGEAMPSELAVAWFLPVMALFATTYLVLALLGIIRSGTETISRFDLSLPALNALWAFSISLYVMSAQGGSEQTHSGWHRSADRRRPSCRQLLVGPTRQAGCSRRRFLHLCRRDTAGPGAAGGNRRFVLSLPIISLVAIFMAVMSRVWNSGTVRATTYLFNIYSCMALVFVLQGGGTGGNGCRQHASGRTSGLYHPVPVPMVPLVAAFSRVLVFQPF